MPKTDLATAVFGQPLITRGEHPSHKLWFKAMREYVEAKKSEKDTEMTTPESLRALASRLRAGEAGEKIDAEAMVALGCPTASGPAVSISASHRNVVLAENGAGFLPLPLSTVLNDTLDLFDEEFSDRWQLSLHTNENGYRCVLGWRKCPRDAWADAPTRELALLAAMCEAAAMEMEAGDAEAGS